MARNGATTHDFVTTFIKENRKLLESGTFNIPLLINIAKINSVDSFKESTAINVAAKKAMMKSFKMAVQMDVVRTFMSQGTTESIALNGEDTFGHPFDSCPLYAIQFAISPNGIVEPHVKMANMLERISESLNFV